MLKDSPQTNKLLTTQSYSPMSQSMTSNTQSSISNLEEEFTSKITISNFPSRAEIISIIEDFIQSNHFPNDYRTENKDNCIYVFLPREDLAVALIKKIKEKKERNLFYGKINFSLELIPNKCLIKKIKNKKSKPSFESIDRLYKGTSHCQLGKQKRYQKTENNYIPSPYRSIQDKELLERKVNKEQWVSPTNFNLFAGSPAEKSKRDIGNFVGGTPSEPPVIHKFREVNKDKWVSPTNFIV